MAENMWSLFGQILLILVFGFLLTRFGILTPGLKKGLSDLLLRGITPVSILSSASETFSEELLEGFCATFVIALVFYTVMLLFLCFFTKRLALAGNRRGIFVTLCTYANVAFIGIPLASALFGAAGLLYSIAFNLCYNLTLFSVGIKILGDRSRSGLKTLFHNTAILASLLALLIFISPFRFPAFVQSAFSSVGSMMTPVSMMLIGCEIASMPVLSILRDRQAYLATFLKMAAAPLAACLILRALPVERETAAVSVFLIALPSGSFNLILGQKYGCDTKFAARVITQNMLVMLGTLPAVLTLSEWLL